MSDTSTAKAPSSSFPSTLKWILSSTFIAGLVALWGTLIGLLYRLGWLSTFGISPDLFMPQSATELTYWGYLAAISIWGDWRNWTSSYTWAAFLFGLAVAFVFLLFVASAIWHQRNKSALQDQIAKSAYRVWHYAGLYAAFVCLTLTLLPWLAITLSGAIVALPLPGYTAGKISAEKAIKSYRNNVKIGSVRCTTLTGPSGTIGKCPYVIAQTKERIAYMDGDSIFIAPADALNVKWQVPERHLKDN